MPRKTKVVLEDMHKAKRDKLSDRLRKELRRTIAMAVLQKVYELDDMKTKDQEETMFKLFHGHGETISFLELFMNGQGPFESMFEGHPDNSGTKRLKSLFTRNNKDYTLGESITKDLLERVQVSKGEVVSGRYLRSSAMDGATEVRKSLPFLYKYLNKELGEPLASGDEIEDVVRKWLTDFYVYLESGNLTSPTKEDIPLAAKMGTGILDDEEELEDDNQSNDDDSYFGKDNDSDELLAMVRRNLNELKRPKALPTADTPDTPETPTKTIKDDGEVVIQIPRRESDWFFPGFMFVLLFGPFADNMNAGQTLDFFLTKDPTATGAAKKIMEGANDEKKGKAGEV